MIQFESHKVYFGSSGTFRIQFKDPCQCLVALAEIFIPNINQHSFDDNGIEIICDQIDSNLNNPGRILKRIPFNRVPKDEHFNSWEAKWFDFKPIDSSDNFLDFSIRRLNKQHVRFNKGVNDRFIYLTLAFKPINDKTLRWNGI